MAVLNPIPRMTSLTSKEAAQDFARHRAVATATEVFWRQGYEETSMADLVTHTGMNRYALYTHFGGKLDLFLTVLEHYHGERKKMFQSASADPDVAPLDAIRQVFVFSIAEMAKRGTGCLMCTIAGEFAQHDDRVQDRINFYINEITEAFIAVLSRAEATKALNPAITPKQAAHLLVSLIMGSGAHARSGASEDEMIFVFDAAMAAISHPHMKT
ncbi:MAG: TetR/AcrR family transcriptional regulator [Pseudomonadota bacterium]